MPNSQLPTDLQEQPILKSPLVPEVMILSQGIVEVAHARREVPCCERVDLFRPYELAIFISKRGGRGRGDAIEEGLGEVLEKGEQTIVFI